MEGCEVCKKKNQFVYCCYFTQESGEHFLCKSHYMSFLRAKDYQEIKKKFKTAKPATARWNKLCRAEGKALLVWIKAEVKERKTR